MRASFTKIGLALALGLAMALAAETALAGPNGNDPTYQSQRSHESFLRYPGDVAVEGGTVRVHGPDKGPYIERCYWTMDQTKPGFGLTQRCYRHTLENTPAPQ